MDLALPVVGDQDHVLDIARLCERNGAVAVSLADRGRTFRTRGEHRDRFGRYAPVGIERVYIQVATRVADQAAECLDRLREG